jgi:hypothetical protein
MIQAGSDRPTVGLKFRGQARSRRLGVGPGPAAGVPHRVEKSKVMLHSQLKRPTISTLFQRPSEGVGKCDFRVTAGGGTGKTMMAFQTTTKGVKAAKHTP